MAGGTLSLDMTIHLDNVVLGPMPEQSMSAVAIKVTHPAQFYRHTGRRRTGVAEAACLRSFDYDTQVV
jgi:hypothetical protein